MKEEMMKYFKQNGQSIPEKDIVVSSGLVLFIGGNYQEFHTLEVYLYNHGVDDLRFFENMQPALNYLNHSPVLPSRIVLSSAVSEDERKELGLYLNVIMEHRQLKDPMHLIFDQEQILGASDRA